MKSTAKYRDAPKVSKELPALQGQAELDYPARDPKLWGLHSSQVAEEHQFVTEVSVAGRPSNLVFRATNRAPYWTFYSVMDYYREEVSILDTIISRSVTEIFRYGIDFEPAFVKKCTNCGHEYQNNVSVCPYCNSRALIRPDESQKDYFVRPDGTSFIDEVNENGQSLKDLCRSYADAQYQNNQAYLLVITGDVIDSETKHLEHSYPLEFISVDPKYVRFLYDETAEPGKLFGFTMDDRHSLIPLSRDPKALNAYTPDGRTIYPAFWQVGSAPGASGELWAYTKDEIYSGHWFKQTLIYGVPQWYSIEDDLLAYHYIEKHNLQRYKYGYVRKILVFPGFSDEVMRNVAKGVQEVLAKSDLSIPIVGLPPQPAGTGELRAQTLDLGGTWEALADFTGSRAAPVTLPGEYKSACALRRQVVVPADWKGRRVRIDFASRKDRLVGVIVNGRYIRRHHHRFGDRTWLDITPFLRFGEANELILVGNTAPGQNGIVDFVRLLQF